MVMATAIGCVLFCFFAGVYLGRPQSGSKLAPASTRQPEALPTGLQDPDFSAPHKPDIASARKTPTPPPGGVDLPDLPESQPGSSTFWVYREGAPLYAEQGLNAPELQKLAFATQVQLLREEEQWAQVQVLGGSIGWLQRNVLADRPPPGARSDQPSQAIKALEAYVAALNRRDYMAAYDALSYDFKRELSYSSFSRGYSVLDQAYLRVVRVQTISPGSVLFYVEMLCEERPRHQAYKGEYVMVLEQSHWRIAQATLNPVDPKTLAPFPSQRAPVEKPFPDPTPEEDENEEEE
jgi:hypothetical protein